MRRDVRITTIYEGTSEIQQNIIGVFRWKKTVSSKGAFYEEMAAACDAAHAENDQCGGQIIAAALRGLNDVVLDAHRSKTIRHQIAQFELADAMCRCEVGAALVHKAVRMSVEQPANAPVCAAAARAFARQAMQAVLDAAHLITRGFAEPGDSGATSHGSELAQTLADRLPAGALNGLWADLSVLGEHLKQLD